MWQVIILRGARRLCNIAEWQLRLLRSLARLQSLATLLCAVSFVWATGAEKLRVETFVLPSCTSSDASSKKASPEIWRRFACMGHERNAAEVDVSGEISLADMSSRVHEQGHLAA